MKRYALIILCMLFLFPVFSQSAEVVSDILNKEQASYGDFSYLVAAEAGMEKDSSEAFVWCRQFESFSESTLQEDPVTIKTVSFFLMNNYELPGGLMWSATRSPRYAWKELKANGFWKPGTDPDHILNGRELVEALNRFSEMFPEARIRDPDTEDGEANR